MNTETLNHCAICNNSELESHSQITDHFGSQEKFDLSICKKCQTLLTNPRPDEKTIINYYKSSSYVSHGDSKGWLFDTLYKSVQTSNFKRKHNIIQKYTLDRKHLDYGCGTGSFINYLNKQQWKTTGLEPDNQARQIAINQNPGSNIHATLSQLGNEENFSSISLFHVLEHVHQLKQTLNTLVQLLDKNGVLILALPNFQSFDAQHYGTHWAGYDVPRHLYHFSQKSIHVLARQIGLNIVATHPMKFDSYYVSLLSEEYMHGKKDYVKAFINGYRSNQAAKRSNEYSSLIYILSK